jgi:hypothetical protein
MRRLLTPSLCAAVAVRCRRCALPSLCAAVCQQVVGWGEDEQTGLKHWIARNRCVCVCVCLWRLRAGIGGTLCLELHVTASQHATPVPPMLTHGALLHTVCVCVCVCV